MAASEVFNQLKEQFVVAGILGNAYRLTILDKVMENAFDITMKEF